MSQSGPGHEAGTADTSDAGGRLACLQRIALGLSGTHTVEEVAEVIITEGLAALGGNADSVALLTEDGMEFVTVRCHGYPPDVVAAYARYPRDSSLPNADAVRTGEALFLATQQERHARYPHPAGNPTRGGRGAQVALPLAVGALGEFMGVTRCAYGEIDAEADSITVHRDYCVGVASMAGTYPRTADRYDAVYEPLGIRASVNVPILRSGRQIATLVVQEARGPRRWSPGEIARMETMAERMTLAVENARLRRAEREQHARNAAILESITDGFVSLDRQWRYAYVNRTAERLLGHDREEMIGCPVWEVFPRWDQTEFARVARRAFDDQTPASLETFTPGSNLWLGTRIYPAPDALSIYFRDVTAQKRAEAERQEAAERQRTLLRDVLASVTEGHLILCQTAADLPAPLTSFGDPIRLSPSGSLHELRRQTRAACRKAGLSEERGQDMTTAVSEAGMNAVVHVGEGAGQVFVDREGGIVQVRVVDRGPGIPLEDLPRATLKKGFTTAGTMGHGMKIVLQTVDRVFLLTGADGTTVVLEQGRIAPPPAWL